MVKVLLKQFNYDSIIIGLLFVYIGIVYFSIAIANIILVISLFIFILSVINKKIKIDFKKHNRYTYLFIITPFILTTISVLNSNNSGYGFKYIWMRVPIIIVSFILVFMELKKEDIKTGLKLFIIFTVSACLFTLYNTIKYINEDVLFVTDFTFLITIIQHPYFGIFVLIAFVSVLEFELVKNKFLRNCVYILFISGVVLSTSRLVYLLFVIIIGYYLFSLLPKRRAFFLGIMLSVFTVVFIISNQSIKEKFQSSYQYDNSPRLKLWVNALNVVKSSNNMTFGIGIGDYYKEKKDVYFFKEDINGTLGYNPHSQIIEFFVTNGVFGLIVMITIMFFGFRYLLRQTIFTIMIFGIIVAFSFTESMLSRQYGVQLYSVFIPLLFNENFKFKNEIL